MADSIENILIGYAVAAWVRGFRACDRNMIGMLLGVSDEDLDIICALLSKWEKEEAIENG